MPEGRRFATLYNIKKEQAIAVLRGNPYKSVHKERENAGSRKACGGIFLKLTEKYLSAQIFFREQGLICGKKYSL